MEELKEAVQAAVADASSDGKRQFALPALSRPTLILVAVGFLALVLAGGGLFAYRANAEKKKVLADLAAQAKREQEVRAADERADMARLAEDARSSHREILQVSPPANTLPPPTIAMSPPEPAAAATASPAKEPVVVEAPVRAPVKKAASAVAEPEASGGCTLSGKVAGDYGKALVRCLEEYNRIEGRPRDGAAPQRR